MKIKKFNNPIIPTYIPSKKSEKSNYEQELESSIYDIIAYEVGLEQVGYGELGEMQISDESREKAAKEIIKYLKQHGLIYVLDANKYNI